MRKLALVAALAAGTSCGIDTESGITVAGFYGIVFEENDNACVSSPESRPITEGLYDAGWGQFGQAYNVYILVKNNLPTNGDSSAGRLNTNDFLLEAVDVEIDNSGPWGFLSGERQAVPVAASVSVNGKLFVSVPILGRTLAEAMVRGAPDRPSPIGSPGASFPLAVRVRARGKLLDGSEVKSNEMLFPITVYNQAISAEVCPQGTRLVGCTVVRVLRGENQVIDVPVQNDGWECVKLDG